MELKDFIKTTLEQIVEGVAQAQKSIATSGVNINPSGVNFRKDGQFNNYDHAMPQEVIFDVGLTETDKKGSSEGIGVFLGSVSLGKKNDAGVETVAITRVHFSVPMILPPGEKVERKPSMTRRPFSGV